MLRWVSSLAYMSLSVICTHFCLFLVWIWFVFVLNLSLCLIWIHILCNFTWSSSLFIVKSNIIIFLLLALCICINFNQRLQYTWCLIHFVNDRLGLLVRKSCALHNVGQLRAKLLNAWDCQHHFHLFCFDPYLLIFEDGWCDWMAN